MKLAHAAKTTPPRLRHLAATSLVFPDFCLFCLLPGDLRANTHSPDSSKPYRVLIIGLDGVRLDALLAAKTPVMDSLRESGAFSVECYGVMPSRSGPGWTTLLTGLPVTEHGGSGRRHIDLMPNRYTCYSLRR